MKNGILYDINKCSQSVSKFNAGQPFEHTQHV